MIKPIMLLLFVTIYGMGTALGTTYTNKYDDVNLDEILHNERLLTNYVKCLKDVGPCTPDATELKSNLCFCFIPLVA